MNELYNKYNLKKIIYKIDKHLFKIKISYNMYEFRLNTIYFDYCNYLNNTLELL